MTRAETILGKVDETQTGKSKAEHGRDIIKHFESKGYKLKGNQPRFATIVHKDGHHVRVDYSPISSGVTAKESTNHGEKWSRDYNVETFKKKHGIK